MAQVQELVAEERPAFRLGDKLESPIRIRLAEGERAQPVTPMLWRTGVAAIDDGHNAAGPPPPVDYYVVPDAVIGGRGAQPRRGEQYIASPTVFPHYVSHFQSIDEPALSPFWTPEAGTRAWRLKAGISVIHYNIVFGHWLLEMFPKLLMLKTMLPHLRRAPIVLPSNAPPYIAKTIRAVLPDWPIHSYDPHTEHVEVEVLILPGMFHDAYFFHSEFGRALADHVRWAEGAARHRATALRDRMRRGAPTGRRLFVSRRHVVSGFRALTNVEALEQVAVDMGFKVISPERMSWRDQVSAFSRAEVIAGEFGSGMHNTLFSPEGARVVCLNWLVDAQSRICNFRRQKVGYVLASDGQPRLYYLDQRFTEYEIDPEVFRNALVTALESGV